MSKTKDISHKKVIYIVPGFKQNTGMKEYQEIIGQFKARKFQIVEVDIDWNRKTMADYLTQFAAQYQPNSKAKVYFFGFSYGAMIVFRMAVQFKPNVLILASLSPYFLEDLSDVPKYWLTYIGKKRVAFFETMSSRVDAKQIKCQTFLLVGEKEPHQVLRRCKEVQDLIKDAELIICPGAKHNLGMKGYRDCLETVINKL